MLTPKPCTRCIAAAACAAAILTGSQVALALGDPTYDLEVIAADLEFPTGITLDAQGNLYFTQLPTPGVPGDEGGSNKVSLRHAKTGMIENLTMGEPEPTFIAISEGGDLYWTCKSAGVILVRDAESREVMPVLTMLDSPSGITLGECGMSGCDVFFTQLPTPGVPGDMGGENTVSMYDGEDILTLTMGEPEPTEIVRAPDGTLYWTCKSAGVILTRDGATGDVSLLLGELDSPTGIALDAFGNLYYTEVPTPGVGGGSGGMNRVSKYNVFTGNSAVVNEGDPQPTDVAVSDDGRSIYWTCTSAGVIVEVAFTPKTGDLNLDDTVDHHDLLLLLALWGECQDEACPGDFDGSGSVGVPDLLLLLANYG